jgi:hypothetical protein
MHPGLREARDGGPNGVGGPAMTRLSILTTAFIGAAAAAAAANAWYSPACATTHFCAPVEGVAWQVPERGGAGHLVVRSAYGDGVLRHAFEVEEARDGALHVCLQYDPFGDLEVTCLMVPHQGY